MKQAFFLLLLLFSISAMAQSATPDTTHKATSGSIATLDAVKKDTVSVPVPVYEKRDTVAAEFLYENSRHFVKKCSGYVVLRGFSILGKDGQLQFVGPPSVIADGLDNRKRPIGRILQLLK